MKCHAGVEFPSGQPCPICKAALGDVCWPGINAELLEVARLRKENEILRGALQVIVDFDGPFKTHASTALAVSPANCGPAEAFENKGGGQS